MYTEMETGYGTVKQHKIHWFGDKSAKLAAGQTGGPEDVHVRPGESTGGSL